MVYRKVRLAIRAAGWLFLCQMLMAAPLAAARTEGLSSVLNGEVESFSIGNRAFYHDDGPTGRRNGHLPASSLNVEAVGHLTVHDARPGMISDVGVLGNFAYLGQFAPGCSVDQGGGVYIIDISDPMDQTEIGFIKTPGTYVGEGVQAIPFKTESFGGDVLVVNGESCETIPYRIGGFSLYDITDPRHPVALVENFGDIRTIGTGTRANQIHSTFAWGQDGKVYIVTVDDEESTAVDIFDITNPVAPVLIAETGLSSWPDAQDAQSDGLGAFRSSFFHDVVVKKMQGHWMMLLSYWDAGYIILNVDNPAAPVFVNDTDFTDSDLASGLTGPEGNAHQAEWSHTGRFILGTTEDFSPFRMHVTTDSGPFTGQTFVASPGNPVQQTAASEPLEGPTYYVGSSCNASLPPRAPSADAIAVIRGSGCRPEEKAVNIGNAGYAAGIIFTGTIPGRCEEIVNMVASKDMPFLFVGRSTGFKILGIEGYQPANCMSGENPRLPPVGTQGSQVTISAQFDGWGDVHLFDAASLKEIDTYSVLESMDPAYATGFGNLSAHEVAVDFRSNLAYLSYYQAGLRVIRFGESGIQEVGHFVDKNGNNFWGVQVFRLQNDLTTYVAASDRDKGLWIFKYTGP